MTLADMWGAKAMAELAEQLAKAGYRIVRKGSGFVCKKLVGKGSKTQY